MSKLTKIALRLVSKGLYQYADQVLDLSKKLQRQKDNNKIIKEIKEEDRIYNQHAKDKKDLTPEFAYPTNEFRNNHYRVEVLYPSFDEEGAPYFDREGVSETLTMNEEDLANYKQQAEKGLVKLISTRPMLPKSR